MDESRRGKSGRYSNNIDEIKKFESRALKSPLDESIQAQERTQSKGLLSNLKFELKQNPLNEMDSKVGLEQSSKGKSLWPMHIPRLLAEDYSACNQSQEYHFNMIPGNRPIANGLLLPVVISTKISVHEATRSGFGLGVSKSWFIFCPKYSRGIVSPELHNSFDSSSHQGSKAVQHLFIPAALRNENSGPPKGGFHQCQVKFIRISPGPPLSGLGLPVEAAATVSGGEWVEGASLRMSITACHVGQPWSIFKLRLTAPRAALSDVPALAIFRAPPDSRNSLIQSVGEVARTLLDY
ncbi:hypothetical protein R3P38DRAFT_2811030 [Favolaschia claudopus]|uniref:Uncharacterized protein n=1 Tax=Favolaschia claudopus TaxID=2862362 RepID=A0AAV9ZAR0_9AGAR